MRNIKFTIIASRAQSVIENAFGILAARWRIFHRSIRATVEHVELYVLTALALHNYLRLTQSTLHVIWLILKAGMEVYI